jgi:hypothetical protein
MRELHGGGGDGDGRDDDDCRSMVSGVYSGREGTTKGGCLGA